MDLSEAIRQGCKMTTPVLGQLVIQRYGRVHACALGAALVALDGVEVALELGQKAAAYDRLAEAWPELRTVNVYDERRERDLDLSEAIWTMNDAGHKRERIADWLEEKFRGR